MLHRPLRGLPLLNHLGWCDELTVDVGPANASVAALGDDNSNTAAWWCPWREAVPDNDIDHGGGGGINDGVGIHVSYHSRISTPPALPPIAPTVTAPP